jgi:hypothetical protein
MSIVRNAFALSLLFLPLLSYRHAFAQEGPESELRTWPSAKMSAVVYSAITDEEPPLLELKEKVLRKAGFADPVEVNPSNDGEISHVITTSSNENLEALSALMDKVVNQ